MGNIKSAAIGTGDPDGTENVKIGWPGKAPVVIAVRQVTVTPEKVPPPLHPEKTGGDP